MMFCKGVGKQNPFGPTPDESFTTPTINTSWNHFPWCLLVFYLSLVWMIIWAPDYRCLLSSNQEASHQFFWNYFSQWSDVFMLPWYLRPCRAEGLHFSAYRHSLLLVSICLLLFLSPSTIVFTACFECPALCSSRVYIFFLRPHESLVLLFPLPTAAATASLAFMMLVSDIPLYTSHTLRKQLQWFQI